MSCYPKPSCYHLSAFSYPQEVLSFGELVSAAGFLLLDLLNQNISLLFRCLPELAKLQPRVGRRHDSRLDWRADRLEVPELGAALVSHDEDHCRHHRAATADDEADKRIAMMMRRVVV